jgi:hypothetical protein
MEAILIFCDVSRTSLFKFAVKAITIMLTKTLMFLTLFKWTVHEAGQSRKHLPL